MRGRIARTPNVAVASDLAEAGIAIMRQNLHRRMPGDNAGVEEALQAWLQRRDDAIPGDVAGLVRVRISPP